MTELELYKFIEQNNVECHRIDNDVVAFIDLHVIEEFVKLIGNNILDDEGINVSLKDGYICVHMEYICEHHDITLTNVFNLEILD